MGTARVDLLDRAIAWRTGRRYRRYIEEFRAMEAWSRDRLEEWRRRRLLALLRHARETVPYWRDVMSELGAEPEDLVEPAAFARLPVLTKDVIDEQGERLNSTEPAPGRTIEKSTGGSTGRNIWLLVDRDTQDRRRGAVRLTESWDRVVPGTRYAVLWGASLEARRSRGARLYDLLANRLFLSAYGVGEEEVASYGARLERFRPEAILSYPSILLHLARRLGRERCRRLGLRVVFTSAEALYPSVAEELEELLGAPVRNRYGSREFGIIATSCPEGEGLHVMDMRYHLEAVEPEKPEAPPELLVTDLDNRATPFLRYRVGDAGRPMAEPCPCGRPFSRLATVEGRSLDLVVTPDGRAFGGTFFTLLLRPFDRSITQFQAVQESDDRLTVRIVTGETYGDEVRRRVKRLLAENMGPAMHCRLEEVDEIPVLGSGKRRFVVSHRTGAPGDGGR